jgi:quercetin dioxygenase-like cupin family protein
MPVMSGFGALEKLPWERVNDKIERRVLAGKHGMIVWWKIKAGAHAGAHQHPHEQIVWMLKGKMDFRIGNERRSMIAGDVAVIPGDTEHEGSSPKTPRLSTSSRHRVKIFSLGVRRLICVRRNQVAPPAA